RGAALQPDGKIVAAGSTGVSNTDFALVRYNPNGSLDNSFGSAGKVTTEISPGQPDDAYAVAVQPDGRIVAAGTTFAGPTSDDFAVVRYETDGSLDGSFGFGGIATTDVAADGDIANAVAVQPDGQIVAAGQSYSPTEEFTLMRYLGWGLRVAPGRAGPGGV